MAARLKAGQNLVGAEIYTFFLQVGIQYNIINTIIKQAWKHNEALSIHKCFTLFCDGVSYPADRLQAVWLPKQPMKSAKGLKGHG